MISFHPTAVHNVDYAICPRLVKKMIFLFFGLFWGFNRRHFLELFHACLLVCVVSALVYKNTFFSRLGAFIFGETNLRRVRIRVLSLVILVTLTSSDVNFSL
jgi:hypothetical protein